MEFEGQYLTYNEYKGLGGTLDQASFNLLEFEARRRIDIHTQNRLHIENLVVPMEVKLCDFNLIQTINKYVDSIDGVGNNNIASETTDGYSISYLTADKIREMIVSKESELEDIIRTYLLGVIFNEQHLLFAGRDSYDK